MSEHETDRGTWTGRLYYARCGWGHRFTVQAHDEAEARRRAKIILGPYYHEGVDRLKVWSTDEPEPRG